MTDARRTLLDNTETSINKLRNYSSSNLDYSQEYSNSDVFQELMEIADSIKSTCDLLTGGGMEYLSDNRLNQIKNTAESIMSTYKKLKEQINHDNARNKARSIRSELEAMWLNLNEYAAAAIPFKLIYGNMNFSDNKFFVEINNRVSTGLNDINNAVNYAKTKVNELNDLVGQIGVNEQSQRFYEEAQTNWDQSLKWKTASMWIGAGLVLLSIGQYLLHAFNIMVPTSTTQAIYMGGSKLLVFTFLAYILYFSVRNYFILRHNYYINRHRANSLATYKVIHDATNDDDTKNVILTYAASCIFIPQDTGYRASSPADTFSLASVLDMVTGSQK